MKKRLVLAAAAASTAAAVAWVACGAPAAPSLSPGATPGAPAVAAARAEAPSAPRAAWLATAPLPEIVPEELGRASCVADVLALDEAQGFDGVRVALARGLAGDEMFAEYLREKITDLIGKDTDKALDVVAWARAQPEHAELLLAAVAAAPGAKDPRVAKALLEATAAGGDLRLRLAAVDALRTQPALDAEGRGALKELALTGDDEDLAWRAARALGSVMNESHALDPKAIEPYRQALVDIAETSGDAAVRAVALEAPMYSDPILPPQAIDELRELMLGEADRDVRELAAFQLGLTDDPQAALEAFRQAFAQEYDECVRWAIVRFAVRAGGVDALPLLEEFARMDPAFVQDLEDFRAIFAAGYADFEQIWLQKPERHACVVEDGQLHGDTHGDTPGDDHELEEEG